MASKLICTALLVAASVHGSSAEKVHQAVLVEHINHKQQKSLRRKVYAFNLEDREAHETDETFSFSKGLAAWKDTAFNRNNPLESIKFWCTLISMPVLLWACFSNTIGLTTILVAWTLSSVGMHVANKYAAVNFHATCLLVIFQMMVGDAMVLGVEYKKMSCSNKWDYLKWLPVPIVFAVMLATSLLSFKTVGLSTIVVVRNLIPIFTFVIEKIVYDSPKHLSLNLIVMFLIAIVGTWIFGYASLNLANLGSGFLLLNCVFTCADKLIQRHLLHDKDFTMSLSLCMVMNNTVGMVAMLVLAAMMGDFSLWKSSMVNATPMDWLLVIQSGMMGCCLGYLGLKLQKIVSATSVLVLQNLNKIMVIGLSMMFMGEAFTRMQMFGCLVSFLGCAGFCYLRLPGETESTKVVH